LGRKCNISATTDIRSSGSSLLLKHALLVTLAGKSMSFLASKVHRGSVLEEERIIILPPCS
jgi:hypothetical protein